MKMLKLFVLAIAGFILIPAPAPILSESQIFTRQAPTF